MLDVTLWVVGRKLAGESEWELQGVFDREAGAVRACRDETYFVGPVVLNQPQPHGSTPWPGAYYPLLEDKDGDNISPLARSRRADLA